MNSVDRSCNSSTRESFVSNMSATTTTMPEGVVNFRDVAAVPNARGFRLNGGLFYRADNLGHLTSSGARRLRELGIRTIVDLRRHSEAEKYPSRIEDRPEIGYVLFDVVGDVPELLSRGDTIRTNELEERNSDGSFRYPIERLVRIYTMILDARQEMLRTVFHALSDEPARPAVFHCVAGQDRTGIVAALLLALAGVPAAVIAEDYSATAEYNHRRYIDWELPAKTGLPIVDVESYRAQLCPPEAMLRTVEHLERRYGGARGYLEACRLPAERIDALERRLRP